MFASVGGDHLERLNIDVDVLPDRVLCRQSVNFVVHIVDPMLKGLGMLWSGIWISTAATNSASGGGSRVTSPDVTCHRPTTDSSPMPLLEIFIRAEHLMTKKGTLEEYEHDPPTDRLNILSITPHNRCFPELSRLRCTSIFYRIPDAFCPNTKLFLQTNYQLSNI